MDGKREWEKGAISTYFIHAPWIYPLVLLVGGVVAVFASKEEEKWNRVEFKPPWKYLVIFAGFACMGLWFHFYSGNVLTRLFESFYRYGYLVIGGG